MEKISDLGGKELQTSPIVKLVVDESLIRELAKQEIQRILAGTGEGSWWDLKRLEFETCRKRDWLLENILLNPDYKQEMAYITNGCEGGRWMFRAAAMRKFLDENFAALNRRARSLKQAVSN
ncbi:DUF771 domain-containing protein [Paenibacillus sp. y28]|uniref:DUF771 domain-containing protein n=1 Tax=Paenibacillus sp. y28 TaxID=3129110 RepID=UPI00301AF055